MLEPLLPPHLDSLRPNAPPSSLNSLRATAHTHAPRRSPDADPSRPTRPYSRLTLLLAVLGFTGLGVGLLSLPSHAREMRGKVVSGTPDRKLTQNGRVQRWQRKRVTVRVDRNVGALGPEALATVERAFVTWMSTPASLPRVDIELTSGLQASLTPDRVNTVIVAPIEAAGHEDDLAITVAYSDAENGEIVEADIIINTRYSIEQLDATSGRAWPAGGYHAANLDARLGGDETGSWQAAGTEHAPSCSGGERSRCGGRYDLESILAHEVGHFYGLGEDDENGLTTMYYCTSTCETHKRTPETPDIATMREIYEEGKDTPVELRCGVARWGALERVPAASRTTLVGLLGLTVLLRRGLRARAKR